MLLRCASSFLHRTGRRRGDVGNRRFEPGEVRFGGRERGACVREIADAQRGLCGRLIGPETLVGACLRAAPWCDVVVGEERSLVTKLEVES